MANTTRRELDERLLDALDTLQQDAEQQATKALEVVDGLDEIRARHVKGEVTEEDVRQLEASISAVGTAKQEEQSHD